MSLFIALALVAVVVIAGLYFLVPAVHTALVNAFNAARDSLDKIVADGEALVTRLEAHAKHQTAAAATHVTAAAAHTTAATTAANNAANASAAASSLKVLVGNVSTAPAVAPTAPPKV